MLLHKGHLNRTAGKKNTLLNVGKNAGLQIRDIQMRK